MNPQLAIALLQTALKLLDDLPALKAAATTEDQEALDALHKEFADRSNGVADRLREIRG